MLRIFEIQNVESLHIPNVEALHLPGARPGDGHSDQMKIWLSPNRLGANGEGALHGADLELIARDRRPRRQA